MPCYPLRQHFIQTSRHFPINSLRVACPRGPILLRPKKERPRENKGPLCPIISIHHSLVCSAVLQRPVRIVYITVEYDSSISPHVLHLDWHCFERPVEDSRIVNVIPGVELAVEA